MKVLVTVWLTDKRTHWGRLYRWLKTALKTEKIVCFRFLYSLFTTVFQERASLQWISLFSEKSNVNNPLSNILSCQEGLQGLNEFSEKQAFVRSPKLLVFSSWSINSSSECQDIAVSIGWGRGRGHKNVKMGKVVFCCL